MTAARTYTLRPGAQWLTTSMAKVGRSGRFRKSVLLVEEALDLGPPLRDEIEEWGRRVFLAATGHEALELLARERVALMLLDHDLPEMSGPELWMNFAHGGRRFHKWS